MHYILSRHTDSVSHFATLYSYALSNLWCNGRVNLFGRKLDCLGEKPSHPSTPNRWNPDLSTCVKTLGYGFIWPHCLRCWNLVLSKSCKQLALLLQTEPSHSKIHQVFWLRFCILQAIKNWTLGRPRILGMTLGFVRHIQQSHIQYGGSLSSPNSMRWRHKV